MNQAATLKLLDFMARPEGWGRAEGREVYPRLLSFVEGHPGVLVFRVSVEGVRRVDISFASETLVELASRFRGRKGFCFVDLEDADMRENWEAAAEKKGQPLMSWNDGKPSVLGPKPTQGLMGALQFTLERQTVRASEFAASTPKMSIANASSKFKALWEQGLLLRREEVAESGGIEFSYQRIG